MKYRFPQHNITGITSHIQAFDAIIESMIPEGSDYIITLSITIDPIQFEHLAEEFGLSEVV